MNKYGLIGEKLSHSLSPVIHSIIFSALNLQGDYNLYETDKSSIPKLMDQLQNTGLKGVNVTIPYKLEVMKYLDDISPQAKAIGAVNTVVFGDKKRIGHNTDYDGFKMMLDYFNIHIQNKKAIVLGSGGASKAIIQCLSDFCAEKVTIVSRNKKQTKENLKNNEVISYDQLESVDKDLMINCTPCGMYPKVNCSPVSKSQMIGIEAAVDLIYNPSQTQFMQTAESLGIKNINGLYMLVGQAVRAQEIWNNISISEEVVERIYHEVGLEVGRG